MNLAISENSFIQRPRVSNDSRDIFSYIAVIYKRPGCIAVTDDLRSRVFCLDPDLSRRQGWQGQLIPPANIDSGVREVQGLNMVQYVFLLRFVTCN